MRKKCKPILTILELEDSIYRYFDEINQEPVPYKWSYKMDTIDLSKEDTHSIVYEVVNAKAASVENKDKKHRNQFYERKSLPGISIKMLI